MIFKSSATTEDETATRPDWIVQARSGHAVITDETGREWAPERLGVPGKLVSSLHEWARVAENVTTRADSRTDIDADHELLAQRGRQLARLLTLETNTAVAYIDPITGTLRRPGRPRMARIHSGDPSGEPTPWATGLMVSALIAGIVLVVLVVVSIGLAEVSWWLAVGVNIAVVAGFTPSIWIGRRIPVWRWVAFGTGSGIALAWFALLLGALG